MWCVPKGHEMLCVWTSEDNFRGLIFRYVGSRSQTQACAANIFPRWTILFLIHFSSGFSYKRHESSTKLLKDFKKKKKKSKIWNYHLMTYQFPWFYKSIGYPDVLMEPIKLW